MHMQGVDCELLERIIHRAVLDLARSVLMETCDECIDQIQTEIDRLQTIERAAMN